MTYLFLVQIIPLLSWVSRLRLI